MTCLTVKIVFADSIVFSDEVGIQPTDWSGTLNIPQFDPSSGVLSSIEVHLTAAVEGESAYENMGPSPSFMTLTHSADIQIALPGDIVVAGLPMKDHLVELPAFDGTFDNAGPSGKSAETYWRDSHLADTYDRWRESTLYGYWYGHCSHYGNRCCFE